MKALITGLLIASLATVGLYWWQTTPQGVQEAGPQPTGRLMKISRSYWPGEFWKEIAHAKGWFHDAGLQVELVDTNSDYFQSLHDFVAGGLDVQNMTMFDLIHFTMQGANLAMVIQADTSWGADAIVARADIERIADLRGTRVGVTTGTYTDYILDVVIRRHGLRRADLTLVPMPTEATVAALRTGQIDAMVAWEPLVTDAMAQTAARTLFDSSEIPGISPSGVVFHRRFLAERPGDVQAFVTVWHKTTQFIHERPEEAFGIIATIYDRALSDVQRLALKDRILDLAANRTAFTYGRGFESLHGAARQINDFMVETQMTQTYMDSNDLLNDTFIRALP